MAEQEKARGRSRDSDDDVLEDVATAESQHETDLEELDDLLDEIDSVLEENAEEFVKNYVQKGGQ